MSNLESYLEKRGITDAQMEAAREATHSYVSAYVLREARKEAGMTQIQVADAMGVSQNRVSRMERGDLATMSLDAIRRYIEALGGRILLAAELPSGNITLL